MEENVRPERKFVFRRLIKNRLVITALIVIILIGGIGGIIYWQDAQKWVYIDKAEISAPVISLAPLIPGVIDKVYVKEGDIVKKGTFIAEVAGNYIKAESNGIIIEVENAPGEIVSTQNPVAKLIDPQELRVVGHIQEDKGLSDIKVGQHVIFTVDAFGSKEFHGYVDSISPTADIPQIAFSISDKREEKEFDVKIAYDINAHPEFRQGMSARIKIYKESPAQ